MMVAFPILVLKGLVTIELTGDDVLHFAQSKLCMSL